MRQADGSWAIGLPLTFFPPIGYNKYSAQWVSWSSIMSRRLIWGIVFTLSTAAHGQDEPLKQALALEASIQQVVDAAEGSVACILVSRSDAYSQYNQQPGGRPGELGRFDPPRVDGGFERRRPKSNDQDLLRRINLAATDVVPDSYGTGIVFDEQRALVLTNFHVVRDATKVYVRLPGKVGSYADIYAADERSDLAVLKLLDPPKDLKALKMGDAEKARKGQFVLAISNPFAAGFRDGSPSVSWGMLSNVRRRLPGEPNEGEGRRPRLHYYPVLLQTDMRMSPGSSGGALLDLRGNWIGLTTAVPGVVGGEGTGGYAIPLDVRMKRIIEKLRNGEEVEYGFLGIQAQGQFGGEGAWKPTPGGPAAQAGMQEGDRIVAIEGNPIAEPDDLLFNISSSLAGTRIRMTVKSRSGFQKDLEPVLVKTNWPSTKPVIAANRPQPVHGLRVDYTSVLAVGGISPNYTIKAGVVIRELVDNSPAAKADLRTDRDIIVAVNDARVNTPKQFYDAVRRSPNGFELTLDDGRTVRLP